MKYALPFILAMFVVTGTLNSCCTCMKGKKSENKSVAVTSPQAIIYTTKEDYSKLVPVTLTPDGKQIASYPDIHDIYYKGTFSYPTLLHKGFYLDNRGINKDVAFLKYTYEEYASLQKTPSAEELYQAILDKNPVDKMFSCGERNKYANIADDLNQMIDSDNFAGFTRLK